MENLIADLRKNYHLLNESRKKIDRYTNISNNCSIVDDNVYTKLELYKNKEKNLINEIKLLEDKVIGETEKIIIKIQDYMKKSNNQNNILATDRYLILIQNKNIVIPVNENIKEKELSDGIKQIFEEEKNTESEIKLIIKNNNELDSVLQSHISLNKYFEKNKLFDSNESIIVDKSNDIINNNIKLKKNMNIKYMLELEEKEKNLRNQRLNLLNERIKITSNINDLVVYLEYEFNNIPYEIKQFFQCQIPSISENKIFNKKYSVGGKAFLNNYINIYHHNNIEIFRRFLNHYEVLKKCY